MMKKIITLILIISFLSHSVCIPVQETGIEKVKNFFTSKPLIFFYGASLGMSAGLYIREFGSYFLVRRGKLIDKEIIAAKGLVNYMKICTKSDEIRQGVDTKGTTFWCESNRNTVSYNTMKILESLEYDLKAYNAWLYAQGKPKINFVCHYHPDSNRIVAVGIPH